VAKSLILHEESDCRELIKRVLLEKGHEVVAFDEEEEALAWTRSNPVDLAIVSLEPGMTQSNICQGLKKLSENLKILVLTTYNNRDLANKALEQGELTFRNNTIKGGEIRIFRGELINRFSSTKEE